eukprot:g47559.t1
MREALGMFYLPSLIQSFVPGVPADMVHLRPPDEVEDNLGLQQHRIPPAWRSLPRQPQTHLFPWSPLQTSDQSFLGVNPRRATGLDSIPEQTVRSSVDQLAEAFTNNFNLSLLQAEVPTCFEKATIIRVPKKVHATCLNHCHPVALTSNVMKCFQRLVMAHIYSSLPACLNPLQFAYQHNRSTAGAVSLALPSSLEHLNNKDTYIKLLLVDYSSAFSTIIPSRLISKPCDLGLISALCTWILSSLTNKPRFIDDTTVVGRISNNVESKYRREIEGLVTWCKENNLSLNVGKELIMDLRKKGGEHAPIYINRTEVERMKSIKFLRVTITDNLSWTSHVNVTVKKAQQRHFFHSLIVPRKKLFLNLLVRMFKLLYLMPDGKGYRRTLPGCDGPLMVLATFPR